MIILKSTIFAVLWSAAVIGLLYQAIQFANSENFTYAFMCLGVAMVMSLLTAKTRLI